jgi:hypothetical protein
MAVHIILTAACALALALLFRSVGSMPFAAWLLWFYWVSLAVLSWQTIVLIRSTPMAPSSNSNH